MKRVLLVGPHAQNIRTGQYLAPPLGIHRLASYLRARNLAEVDVIDPCLQHEPLDRAYDYIGTSMLHPTLPVDIDFLYRARQAQPKATIIGGGQGAKFHAEMLLRETPLDMIIQGWGEKPLAALISGEQPERIPGILTRDIKGMPEEQVTTHEFREISMSIDFSTIPFRRYWEHMNAIYRPEHQRLMKTEGMMRTVRLMTSNYCPMGCTFCSSTRFLGSHQRFYQLDAEDVVKLMESARKAEPEVESYYFNDDDFMINTKRMTAFCTLVREKFPEHHLMCMGRIDDPDGDMLTRMAGSGFSIIFYGVETFSDRLAMEIGKSSIPSYGPMAYQKVLDTIAAGITPQISLMLFIPTTTDKDLETTIDVTVDLLSQGARATVFPYVEAFAGTPIVDHHNVQTQTYSIHGQEFTLPTVVLPDDVSIRMLAERAIKRKHTYNSLCGPRYGGVIPQPIDTLHLFKSVYEEMGKPTSTIDNLLLTMVE